LLKTAIFLLEALIFKNKTAVKQKIALNKEHQPINFWIDRTKIVKISDTSK